MSFSGMQGAISVNLGCVGTAGPIGETLPDVHVSSCDSTHVLDERARKLLSSQSKAVAGYFEQIISQGKRYRTRPGASLVGFVSPVENGFPRSNLHKTLMSRISSSNDAATSSFAALTEPDCYAAAKSAQLHEIVESLAMQPSTTVLPTMRDEGPAKRPRAIRPQSLQLDRDYVYEDDQLNADGDFFEDKPSSAKKKKNLSLKGSESTLDAIKSSKFATKSGNPVALLEDFLTTTVFPCDDANTLKESPEDVSTEEGERRGFLSGQQLLDLRDLVVRCCSMESFFDFLVAVDGGEEISDGVFDAEDSRPDVAGPDRATLTIDDMERLLLIVDLHVRDVTGLSLAQSQSGPNKAGNTLIWEKAMDASIITLSVLSHGNRPLKLLSDTILDNNFRLVKELVSNLASIATEQAESKPIKWKGKQPDLDGPRPQVRDFGSLLSKLAIVLEKCSAILTRQHLQSNMVLSLQEAGMSVFFVDGLTVAQPAASAVLRNIFRFYQLHRQLILDEIVLDIGRLPTTRRNLRTYRISGKGVDIQVFTALILQLFQCTNTDDLDPEATALKLAREKEGILSLKEGLSGLDGEKDPLDTIAPRSSAPRNAFSQSMVTARGFLCAFLEKCSKKQGKADYRVILRNFLHDCSLCLCTHEFPVASDILSEMSRILIQKYIGFTRQKQSSGDNQALGTIIELLGFIAATVRRTQGSMELFGGEVPLLGGNQGDQTDEGCRLVDTCVCGSAIPTIAVAQEGVVTASCVSCGVVLHADCIKSPSTDLDSGVLCSLCKWRAVNLSIVSGGIRYLSEIAARVAEADAESIALAAMKEEVVVEAPPPPPPPAGGGRRKGRRGRGRGGRRGGRGSRGNRSTGAEVTAQEQEVVVPSPPVAKIETYKPPSDSDIAAVFHDLSETSQRKTDKELVSIYREASLELLTTESRVSFTSLLSSLVCGDMRDDALAAVSSFLIERLHADVLACKGKNVHVQPDDESAVENTANNQFTKVELFWGTSSVQDFLLHHLLSRGRQGQVGLLPVPDFSVPVSIKDKLAYLIEVDRPLFSISDSLLRILLVFFGSKSNSIRARAMKALLQVVNADASIVEDANVYAVVSERLCDASAMVRDSTVKLIAEFIRIEPSVTDSYVQVLEGRIVDTATSVRRSVLKTLRYICRRTPTNPRVPNILDLIVRRLKDDEETVRNDARNTFEDLWFSGRASKDEVQNLTSIALTSVLQKSGQSPAPSPTSSVYPSASPLPSPTFSNFSSGGSDGKVNISLADRLDQIVEVISKSHSFQWLVDIVFELVGRAGERMEKVKKSDASRVMGLCEQLTSILVENIIRSDVVEGSQAATLVEDLLTTLRVFAEVDYAFIVNHVRVLLTYTGRSKPRQVIENAMEILSGVVPFLETIPVDMVGTLERNCIVQISTGSKASTVNAAAKLLAVMTRCTVHGRSTVCSSVIWDCFLKNCTVLIRVRHGLEVLAKDGKQLEPARAKMFAAHAQRAFFIAGTLSKYFDFDTEIPKAVHEKRSKEYASGPAPGQVFSFLKELCLYFAQQSHLKDETLHARSLQGLVFVLMRRPAMVFGSDVQSVIRDGLCLSHESSSIFLLQAIDQFLRSEARVVRMQQAPAEHVGASLKPVLDPVLKTMSDMAGAGGLVQSFLPEIRQQLLSRSSVARPVALSILQFVVEQGLGHPGKVFPYLVALCCDTNRSLRRQATSLVALIASRHGFVCSDYYQGVELGFRFQLTALSELRTSYECPDSEILYDSLLGPSYFHASSPYGTASANKSMRRTVLAFMARRISPLVVKDMLYEIRGIEKWILETRMAEYFAQTLAALPYRFMDEVLCVVSEANGILSMCSDAPAEEFKKLGAANGISFVGSSRAALRSKKGLTLPEKVTVLKVPNKNALDDALQQASMVVLGQSLKIFLKEAFGVTAGHVQGYKRDEVGTVKDQRPVKRNETKVRELHIEKQRGHKMDLFSAGSTPGKDSSISTEAAIKLGVIGPLDTRLLQRAVLLRKAVREGEETLSNVEEVTSFIRDYMKLLEQDQNDYGPLEAEVEEAQAEEAAAMEDGRMEAETKL